MYVRIKGQALIDGKKSHGGFPCTAIETNHRFAVKLDFESEEHMNAWSTADGRIKWEMKMINNMIAGGNLTSDDRKRAREWMHLVNCTVGKFGFVSLSIIKTHGEIQELFGMPVVGPNPFPYLMLM